MAAKWQQWMPLYVDRWRGSSTVRAMHPTARSGYLELLLEAWQSMDCTVSSDPVKLAGASGLSAKLWRTYGPSILLNFEAVTVGDTVTVRLRNKVEYEEWLEAKRIFEARKEAADRTNKLRSPQHVNGRSPSRSANTITGTVTETLTNTKTGTGGAPLPQPPEHASGQEPRYDFDADPEEHIPEGLATGQYAHFALTACSIPAGIALEMKTGAAIEMLSRLEFCGMGDATKLMIGRMRAAQSEGATVNGFWFEDCKWKVSEVAGISTEGWE